MSLSFSESSLFCKAKQHNICLKVFINVKMASDKNIQSKRIDLQSIIDAVVNILENNQTRVECRHVKERLTLDKELDVSSLISQCVELGFLVYVSFDGLDSLCTPELVDRYYGSVDGMKIVPYTGEISSIVESHLLQLIDEKFVDRPSFTTFELFGSLKCKNLLRNYSIRKIEEIIKKAISNGFLKEIDTNVYSLTEFYKKSRPYSRMEIENTLNCYKTLYDNKRLSDPLVDYPFISNIEENKMEEERHFWDSDTDSEISNISDEIEPIMQTETVDDIQFNDEEEVEVLESEVIGEEEPVKKKAQSLLRTNNINNTNNTNNSDKVKVSHIIVSFPLAPNITAIPTPTPTPTLTHIETEKAAFLESIDRLWRIPKCFVCRESSLCSKWRPYKYPNIHCSKCDVAAHFNCLRLDKSTGVRMGLNRQWRCSCCEWSCFMCSNNKFNKSSDAPERDFAIQCTSCRQFFHTKCTHLDGEDGTEWDCPNCWNARTIFFEREIMFGPKPGDRHLLQGPSIAEFPDSRLISHQPSLDFHSLFRKKSATAIKDNFIMWVHRELASSIKDDLTPLYHLPNEIYSWTPKDVGTFVTVLGWPKVGQYLADQAVDGTSLLMLRMEDIIDRLLPDPFAAQKLHITLARLDQDFLD